MKLSDYVAFLNLLDTVDVTPDRVAAVRGLAAIVKSVTDYQHQIHDFTQRLQNDFADIRQGLDHFSQTISELRSCVQQIIIQQESDYLQNSIRIYQSEMIHESHDYILNRKLVIQGDDLEYVNSRLRCLSDWRYPGMCIRPGLDDYVKIMVPLDPLYIVDQGLDLLDPAIQQFDPQYQRRLRQYTVNDYRSTAILEKLPDSQFALVFAYNFFNYRPLPVIERYMTEIYAKLRPGGTVIITYNNCDRAHSVRLSEHNFMMYTPFRLLKPVLEKIGYIDISTRVCDGDTDILEIVKPGELATIRGGQTLAKIFADS